MIVNSEQKHQVCWHLALYQGMFKVKWTGARALDVLWMLCKTGIGNRMPVGINVPRDIFLGIHDFIKNVTLIKNK